MFNLLRMDLRRLFRGKALYICLICAIAFFGLIYWSMKYAVNESTMEEVQAEMQAEGGDIQELDQYMEKLSRYSMLDMFHEGVATGCMAILCAIIIQILVIEDFESGFAKGIFATYKKRWKYVGSKLVINAIASFLFISVTMTAGMAINFVAGSIFPYAKITDILFYGLNLWLLVNAFSALILCISLAFRNKAVSIVAEIVLGLGLVVQLLYQFFRLFHVERFLNYTLYHTFGQLPKTVSDSRLSVILVGAGFLILYSVLSKVALDKADI